jgi:hypothetical protein
VIITSTPGPPTIQLRVAESRLCLPWSVKLGSLPCRQSRRGDQHSSTNFPLLQPHHGIRILNRGCQMVSFHTKNSNLGKSWRASDGKILIYFMAIWNTLRTFGIFYDHLVHFVFIWYIFPALVSCTKKNLKIKFEHNLPQCTYIQILIS